MRVTRYYRKLGDGCVLVYGNHEPRNIDDFAVETLDVSLLDVMSHTAEFATNEPIEMALAPTRSWRDHPKRLEELLDYVTIDEYCGMDGEDFAESLSDFKVHYREIFCGTYPGWNLIGFEVYNGCIQLLYGCMKSEKDDYAYFITIDKAPELHLAFKLQELPNGFAPTYYVHIVDYPNLERPKRRTIIRENLGYMRCDMELFLKGDETFAKITEYMGL